MKSLSAKLGVILIGLAIFGCAGMWGTDWKYFGESGDSLFYYYPKNISYSSMGTVRVWGKTEYAEKGIIGMVEKFGSRYENLKYSLDLWELKCAEKTIHIIDTTYHSKNGEVLDSKKNYFTQWKSIVPGSVEASLHKQVRKKMKERSIPAY